MNPKELPSLSELYAHKKAIEDLVNSRGWELLAELARKQVAARRSFVYNPINDPNGVYAQEFVKGEAVGIETFLRLPGDLLKSLEEDIKMARAHEGVKEDE